MVRLTDLHDAGRKNAEALDCPDFSNYQAGDQANQQRTNPKSCKDRKVALISSAGLIQRGDQPFRGGDAGYRAFTDAVSDSDILMSHISINFDRTAAIKNIESILPRSTLRELADAGEIGEAATTHYSFMGATDPLTMEEHARELSAQLKRDGVDSIVLLPV